MNDILVKRSVSEYTAKITDDNKCVSYGRCLYTIIYQIGDDYFCCDKYFIESKLYYINFNRLGFVNQNFYSYV